MMFNIKIKNLKYANVCIFSNSDFFAIIFGSHYLKNKLNNFFLNFLEVFILLIIIKFLPPE